MAHRSIALLLLLCSGALRGEVLRVFPPHLLELPPILTLLPGAPVQWSPFVRFPAIPDAMPLFTETPNAPPLELMAQLPGGRDLQPFSATPFAKQFELNGPESLLAASEQQHQRAWADRDSGDAAMYPTLATLNPLTEMPEQLRDRAEAFLRSRELALQDDTAFAVDERPQVLMRARGDETDGKWSETPPQSYLAYFAARRYVAGQWWVDGPGSRAIVAIGHDNAVAGFLRVWKRAKQSGMISRQTTLAEVRAAIEAQLRPATRAGAVTVLELELVYYDGNGAFLQPAYRFSARIRHRAYPADVDEYVAGYVPYGAEKEPLPRLDAIAEEADTDGEQREEPAPGDPYVGRYITRDDDPGWANDAAGFWRAVSGGATGASFTNRQRQPARPEMFVTAKRTYVNAMHVALVEAHGDWGEFWTNGCCDGLVFLPSNGRPAGYGSAAGGALATLILHGCEIIPAPPDDSDWALRWRSVFRGLHNIVGYRTPMVITDGAGAAYGASLSRGAPVVSAWTQDVASLDQYHRPRSVTTHDRRHRLGRASAIAVCGHEDDAVFSRSPIVGPLCLTGWWIND
ncbi:MAG TPA: DUF6345 domain-containing protein [Thermoanaerobaculia bacterium]|nr:DUF6345 domain-containing protein [Thermoanaerobaculia bacterium]